MKMKYFFLMAFLFLSGGSVWAQLSCTNCTITPTPIVPGQICGVPVAGVSKSPDNISVNLTGASTFTTVSNGQYIVRGVVSGNFGFTLQANQSTVTQLLKYNNTYMGNTTVAQGTLQLDSIGTIGAYTAPVAPAVQGRANYTDELAIAAATTFFNNSFSIQEFQGNISGAGTYTQAGTGKTIITGAGAKDFTGAVQISGGFLGGQGSLAKAASVLVGPNGSMGGGEGVAGTSTAPTGGILSVGNLTFQSDGTGTATLVATSQSTTGTPSLINVYSAGGVTSGAGTIAVTTGFYVSLLDANLVGGQLIKCNVTATKPILPTTPASLNNTGKTPCYQWLTDAEATAAGKTGGAGLYMTLFDYTITLTGTQLCHASSGANPKISAAYSNHQTIDLSKVTWSVATGAGYAAGYGSGSWVTTNITPATPTMAPTVIRSSNGFYNGVSVVIYAYEETPTCTVTSSITITVKDTQSAPGGTSPIAYCQYAAATPLTATSTAAIPPGGSKRLMWLSPGSSIGSTTAPVPDTDAVGAFNYSVYDSLTYTASNSQESPPSTCPTFKKAITVNVSTGTSATLTTSTVCPKGTNAGNPSVVITATYPTAAAKPASNYTWTLSDPSAAKATPVQNDAASATTATYTFDGDNTGASDKTYVVRLRDANTGTGCLMVLKTRINRQAGLQLSTSAPLPNASTICVGGSTKLNAANGNNPLGYWSFDTAIATVTPSSGQSTAPFDGTVTGVAAGTANIFCQDKDGCNSEPFAITVMNTGKADITFSGTCPTGSGVNPPVVITATYNGTNHIPANATPADATFTFSPNVVKSGTTPVVAFASEGVAGQADRVTYTFSSNNTTNANIPYTITYSDGVAGVCPATGQSVITLQPQIAAVVPNAATTFCQGAVVSLNCPVGNTTPAGQGPITFWAGGNATGTGGASNVLTLPAPPTANAASTPAYTITATGANPGNAYIYALDKDNCKSEPLQVTVLALPILDNFANLVLCAGQVVQPWTPLSTGATGNTIPDGFKWAQTGTANTYDVGFADNPLATGIWENRMDGFTAMNTTAAQVGRDVQVWARNSTTGCTISKNLLIQVNPAAPTISAGTTNLCAGNTYTDIITVTGDNSGTWAVYNEGTNTVANPVVITAANGTTGKGSLSIAAVTALTKRDVVKINTSNCKSNAITFTINPLPVSDDYGDFAICPGAQKNITPTSSVTTDGPTKPDGYIWVKESGSETGIIYPASGMRPLSLNFTGVNTTATINGSIGITPYNAATGCTGAKQVTSITVSVGPPLSVSSVCPKGTDTGNPDVVITAAYTGLTKPATFPANPWSFDNTSIYVAAPVLNNTLANPTATFAGKATADGTPNAYTVTYNDGSNCVSTLSTQIDPQIILAGTIPASFCIGAAFIATVSRDNGAPVTFISDNTALATVTPTTLNQSPWETEVRAAGAGVVKIRAANKNQCKSEPLEVTVLALPILDNFANLLLCAGQVVQPWTPLSTGATGNTMPDGFKWAQSGTANTYDVGLADNPLATGTWKSRMDGFTAANTTAAQTGRDVQVWARNSATGCTISKNLLIQVSPATLTISAGTTTFCAGNTYTDIITIAGDNSGTWAVYNEGTTTAANPVVITAANGSTGKGSLSVAAVTAITKRDVVKISAGNCKSNTITFTVNPAPLMNDIADLEVCNNAEQPAIIPASTGTITDKTIPDRFKWALAAGTLNNSNVGLADHTVDWSMNAINGFTAVNTTSDALTRTITVWGQNTATMCSVSKNLNIVAKPAPVVSISAGSSANLCAGTYTDIISVAGDNSGAWAVYNQGIATAANPVVITAANGSTGRGSLNVAAVTAITKRDVVKYGSNSCRSNAITFTINPAPLMNDIADLDLCANAAQPAIRPTSTGTGITVPTNFQWQVLPAAAHTDDAGLPDYAADWNKVAIDAFTAKDPASNTPAKTQLIRDVTITPRNNTTGCTGAAQTFTITVKTGLTLTVENTSPICNRTGTNIFLRSNLTNTMYEWTVNAPAPVTGQSPSTGTTQPLIAQILNSTSAASETVTYSISATSGNCHTLTPYTVNVAVSKDTPATPVVTGGGHFCVAAVNATYSTNIVPGVPNYNGTVEWTYTSAPREGSSITGNTQKATRGSLTVVTDRLIMSGVSGWIDYKFRPYTTCLGNESPIIGVMVHTSPVADPPANSAVCSGTATNIALSSPTDPAVKYTWQVDKTNGPAVSGETTISEAGAAINGIPPHKQPDEARIGPIVNTLSIPANASTQTIDYRVKPWLAGCQGTEVRITVTVNPLPAVMAPADIGVCSGGAVPANTLTGTNFPTVFKWSGDAISGLADQAVYAIGLPGFTAATTTSGIIETVSIWGKNNNGCISAAATFKITVQAIPAVIFDPATHPKACAGATIDLAGSTNIAFSSAANLKYTWSADYTPATGAKSAVEISKDNTTLVAFPTSSTTGEDGPLIKKLVASAGSTGTITFTVTPWAGTCQGVSNTIDVPVAGGGSITSIVENKKPVICSGAVAEIAVGLVGDGNTYTWATGRSNNITGNLSGNGNGGTTIADGLSVSDKQQGWVTYYITAGSAGCVGATRGVTVNVDPVPVITTPATAQTMCSGTSTAITLANDLGTAQSADVSYTWTVADNTMGATASTSPQATFAQQVLSNTTQADATAMYVFTPWYHPSGHPGCVGPAISLLYTVLGRVSAGEITGADRKICFGDVASLTSNAQGGGTLTYQWWKDGVKIDGATGSAYLLPALVESDASYAVSISNACQTDITSPALMIGVTADAYFTNGGATAVAAPSTLNVGDKVQFTYSGPVAACQWDFGDGTFTSTMMNPAHTYTRGETFNSWLKATKPGNAACTKTFTIPITVNGTAYSPVTGDPVTGFKLFPIPAKDRVTIQSEGTLNRITVSDLSGKTVFSTEAAGHETTLAMGNLSSGIYILTIVDSQGVKRVKISKD